MEISSQITINEFLDNMKLKKGKFYYILISSNFSTIKWTFIYNKNSKEEIKEFFLNFYEDIKERYLESSILNIKIFKTKKLPLKSYDGCSAFKTPDTSEKFPFDVARTILLYDVFINLKAKN